MVCETAKANATRGESNEQQFPAKDSENRIRDYVSRVCALAQEHKCAVLPEARIAVPAD